MNETFRLRGLKLKRVSLVDDPANEHARVVLFKRDDQNKATRQRRDHDVEANTS